jgi:osmotically-inducible protein OsmY
MAPCFHGSKQTGNMFGWSIAALLIMGGSVLAQGGGGSMGSSGLGGGSSGGSFGGGAGGFGGNSSGNSSSASSNNIAPQSQIGMIESLGANTSRYGGRYGGSQGGVSQSNVFGAYYAEPLAGGISSSSSTRTTTFGTPLYNTTTSTTTRLTASTATGGYAGSTGTSAAGNYRMTQGPAYSVGLGFRPPAVAPAQVQTDIQQILATSMSLSPQRDIRVEMSGPVVVLRGNVASERDRHMAEGMIRLTPGVRDVRNELTVSGATP